MIREPGESMARCLICDAPVAEFLSFGRMPIANGFLTPAEFESEPYFDLDVGHCERCQMVQLTSRIDPHRLFHGSYPFFSSTSSRMVEHFREFAASVRRDSLQGPDPLVVEIGSNDGILLQHFAQAGLRHLGIEPSANVAESARGKGIKTVSRFFDEEAGRELRAEHGPAGAILGANVICHLPEIHSVIRGVLQLLDERGVFVFEEPYLGDIVAKGSYDQIYDEHYLYFSLTSLTELFARHGLEVVDVTPQAVHGGSMRYAVARRGARRPSETVAVQRAREEAMGLSHPATYARFRERVHRSRDELLSLLRDLKRQGKRIAAYGATSKSTTVTNFCGIGPDLIEFISDTTPIKQGKYSPGVHIPVLPYDRFRETRPDYALLFAWNHAEEILQKETEFLGRGGKFLVYVPKVGVLA
jgi:methylation protein EvaC